MTRVYYDTEFLEDGATIELISIGLVADDGREYYAVNRDFRWQRIASRRWYAPWHWDVHQQWLLDNVVPSLPKIHGDRRNHVGNGPLALLDLQHPDVKPKAQIAREVRDFLLGDPASDQLPHLELWADYGAYDHVALCQLWGRMIDLPEGVPMWTHDLQQVIEAASRAAYLDELGQSPMPEQPDGLHNALADARHARDLGRWVGHQ